MKAPAYKISKLLVNRLNNLLNLRNHYIFKDSTALANELTKLKLDENRRMITLDIKDLYVNITIRETLRIAKTLLLENMGHHIHGRIQKKVHNFLKENNFQKLQKDPTDKYRNSLPKHYYTATLLSIRNKSSTSHIRNLNPPT